MDKRYFLGFDGGGTKTHACLIDEDDNVVGESYGPASSIDTVPLDFSLDSLVRTFSGLPSVPLISGIFVGLGGIAGSHHVEMYVDAVRKLPFVAPETVVGAENDVMNALASGTGRLKGMTLIVGTGSVCFGMHQGKTWRTGGYHYKEGDAGSGYDLGFQALKHYARVIDHRLPASPFSRAIGDALGIDDFTALVGYFDHLSRTEVAKLAPLVALHAPTNPHAAAICQTAAAEIGLLVGAVYRELGFAESDLTIVGGLGNADTAYRTMFLAEIARISPAIRVIHPLHDPARAAAAIAKTLYEEAAAKGTVR